MMCFSLYLLTSPLCHDTLYAICMGLSRLCYGSLTEYTPAYASFLAVGLLRALMAPFRMACIQNRLSA